MKKYVGILTNTFLDINNVQMTDEAIKDILRGPAEVPVTLNFGGTIIGRTTKLFIADDKALACEFEIDETRVALLDRSYIVPGLENVEYHLEGRTRVIDSGDLTEASISLLPSNPHLTPIKLKGASLTRLPPNQHMTPIELKGEQDEQS